MKTMETLKTIEIEPEDLPMNLKFKSKGYSSEYVLKLNRERTGIFVNKKEA